MKIAVACAARSPGVINRTRARPIVMAPRIVTMAANAKMEDEDEALDFVIERPVRNAPKASDQLEVFRSGQVGAEMWLFRNVADCRLVGLKVEAQGFGRA
jgi:hypothetical protein